MRLNRIEHRSGWAKCTALTCSAMLMLSAMLVPSLPSRVFAQTATETEESDTAIGTATEPVLVVSICSLNKLMQDVSYLSSVVGQPQAGGMFQMIAGGFTQGLDMSRPFGVIVPIVDGAPEPIGMVPTPDVEMMLKRLEQQTGRPADKLDDGTLVVSAGTSLVYIRQSGEWAIVARQKEFLDLAPEDPAETLAELGDNYTLAVRLLVDEIPEDTREALIGQIRQGFEQAMQQQGDGDGATQAASEDSIAQIEQLIRESAELMFGFNVDSKEKYVSFDSEFYAAEGTELAEMYAGQQPIASLFSSVVDSNNAMYYHAAASLDEKVIERTRQSMDSVNAMIDKAINDSEDLEPSQKEDLNEAADALLTLFMDTMAEGKFDVGAKAVADDGMINFCLGMFVADGTKAAALAKDIADKVKSVEDAPTFSFDEATYKGVTMHSVHISIPEEEAEMRETFGEELVVKIGTAPKAVYVATGTESEATLKSFIDAQTTDDDPADRPLGQMEIQLLPFLRFAQSVKANDVVAAMIDTLSQDAETDYLSVESNVIENGQAASLEIGEGILKAIGAAVREAQAQQMQQQQGGGQF